MFSAFRRSPAAILFVLISGFFSSAPGPAETSTSKPRDFGTTSSVESIRGPAAIAGLQSTSSIIVNEPVCSALYDQFPPVAVPDGGGGMIVVWSDFRAGEQDIYAQKLDAAGVPQWATDGVPICKVTGAQSSPQVLSDGAGGAFVVWEDARAGTTNLNIYAQRVSVLGVNLWGNGGVLVCGAANHQRQPVAGHNGLGGVLITWVDERGTDADIYAQRLNASGVAQWTANGVALCTATGVQETPAVVSDAQGGALVVWRDDRSGVDIYGQRVNELGAAQWTANGVAISTAAGNQDAPTVIADGNGGMFVAWNDARNGASDIYAQRLSGAGAALWTAGGAAISNAAGDQKRPRLARDGGTGVVLVWEDYRDATADVYAQRVNSTGVRQWLPADGVGVCTAPEPQLAPVVASDPLGGSIVAWSDARSPASAADVYAQHLQPDGTSLWNPNGVQLCDAAGVQDLPVIVADGAGGAAVTWRDYRNGGYSDLYGQRVDAGGQVPDQCTPPDTLSTDVHVATVASQNYRTFRQGWFYWSGVAVRSNGGDYDLEMYDQGGFGLGPYPSCFGLPLAGSYSTNVTDFVMANFNDNHTPPGQYGVRAYRYGGAANATIEWDDGPHQMALNTPYGQSETWAGVLDVYDVPLTAGNTYTFELNHLPDVDIKVLVFTSYGAPGYYYVVPRSARVMESIGRYGLYTAPSSEYYGVAVVKDNDMVGGYNLIVRPGVVTGVDDVPPATRLQGISPNPGRGPVSIRFALSAPGKTSFQIFDMAGRAVASIPEIRWASGSWSVSWDGRDSGGRQLSPGIYFVQMNVDGRRVGFSRIALLHQ